MKNSVISVLPVVNFKDTELGPIPEHWQVVRLGEVGKVVTGRTPSTSESKYWNGAIPFITPVDLEGGSIHYAARSITQEGLKQAKPLPRGTVLVSCIGYIGKIGVIETDIAVTNQQINAIIPHNCDNWFLAYALMQEAEFLKSRARMTTVPILHKTNFENIPIPLPPLPEQRAIAHVLRTVQEAKAATERVIAALRELKKSLMRHLFTYGPVPLGERDAVPLRDTELGSIPEHWQVVRLGEVVQVKGGKRLPKGDEFSPLRTPYPYIRVVDFENNSVRRDSLKYLTPAQHRSLNRYVIGKQDVYISIAGTIGLVGTIPEELDGAHLTENAARMILDERRIHREFLVYSLDSEQGQEQIQARATKTSQPKLALTRIKEIPIPLPPLPEQQEIARILQAVDRRIQAEEAYARALGDLFKSLLGELMSGRRRVQIIEEGAP